jgi:hypothetical protein
LAADEQRAKRKMSVAASLYGLRSAQVHGGRKANDDAQATVTEWFGREPDKDSDIWSELSRVGRHLAAEVLRAASAPEAAGERPFAEGFGRRLDESLIENRQPPKIQQTAGIMGAPQGRRRPPP